MQDSQVNSIDDLIHFRSAPLLSREQSDLLMDEMNSFINEADSFTLGIMAKTTDEALKALDDIKKHYNWAFSRPNKPNISNEPVFLKANQKTGNVLLRIEYNLGEGILISCQHYQENKEAKTIGPLPLIFFQRGR